jgi:hypothetical protein
MKISVVRSLWSSQVGRGRICNRQMYTHMRTLDARSYHPPQSLLTLSAFQDSPLWSHSAPEEHVLVAKCTVLLHLPVVNVVHDDSGYAITP